MVKLLGNCKLLMNKFRHNFTLLEILVAVAVLVIMMGFLFQFVISAQRVWAASTARTYMADQANAVFQLMAEDLSQMVTVTEEEEPDAFMGWYCNPNLPNVTAPADLDKFCFFILDHETGHGHLFSVMYEYDHTAKKLYRMDSTPNSVWDKAGQNATPSNPTTDFGLPAASAAGNDDYLVAENVAEFKVQGVPVFDKSTTTIPPYPLIYTKAPRFIRVTMTVEIPDELSNGTSNDGSIKSRTFSRVFFLDRLEKDN